MGARAATASVFCTRVYLHCIESQEDLVSRQIEDALDADTSSRWSSQCVQESGSAHRRLRRDAVRYMSVNRSRDPRISNMAVNTNRVIEQ